MAIKFGLTLPYNTARLVPQLAQLAEEHGWDGCFLGDAIWCEDPMVALAAAAMTTSRIRLGTMVIPVPLRRPWKIAGESVAVDQLSNGRLILGLGTGATWMGWHSFPNEVTETKARAEMLDETIDILTLLYQRKQLDYAGKHYQLRLTTLDEQHYPPKPVQQPRIPLWIPAIWPRQKPMQRVLKCDGLFAEKLNPDGKPATVTPDDVREMAHFVQANRTLTTPFDIVVSGQTGGLAPVQQADLLMPWLEAGVTWWIEEAWGEAPEVLRRRIQEGPPQLV